jgi:hypothetical protein
MPESLKRLKNEKAIEPGASQKVINRSKNINVCSELALCQVYARKITPATIVRTARAPQKQSQRLQATPKTQAKPSAPESHLAHYGKSAPPRTA